MSIIDMCKQIFIYLYIVNIQKLKEKQMIDIVIKPYTAIIANKDLEDIEVLEEPHSIIPTKVKSLYQYANVIGKDVREFSITYSIEGTSDSYTIPNGDSKTYQEFIDFFNSLCLSSPLEDSLIMLVVKENDDVRTESFTIPSTCDAAPTALVSIDGGVPFIIKDIGTFLNDDFICNDNLTFWVNNYDSLDVNLQDGIERWINQ